jgi:ABC-type uncharacterized transport system auxiliary subunit
MNFYKILFGIDRGESTPNINYHCELSAIIWVLVLFLLLFTGCVNIPQQQIKIDHYPIQPYGEFARADTTLDISLKINRFTVDSAYRGFRMVYLNEMNELSYYYYHRWMTSPEWMLADALAVNFRNWGLIGGGLFQEDYSVLPTHELSGRLNKLYAINVKDEYQAILRITITLSRIEQPSFEGNLLFQKQYSYNIAREDASVVSYIAAVDSAAGLWLGDLRRDLEPILTR